MNDQSRAEYRERVVRTVDYNTSDGESRPDALDADHIRVHLCANGGYPVDEINRAIADALEAGERALRRDTRRHDREQRKREACTSSSSSVRASNRLSGDRDPWNR